MVFVFCFTLLQYKISETKYEYVYVSVSVCECEKQSFHHFIIKKSHVTIFVSQLLHVTYYQNCLWHVVDSRTLWSQTVITNVKLVSNSCHSGVREVSLLVKGDGSQTVSWASWSQKAIWST